MSLDSLLELLAVGGAFGVVLLQSKSQCWMQLGGKGWRTHVRFIVDSRHLEGSQMAHLSGSKAQGPLRGVDAGSRAGLELGEALQSSLGSSHCQRGRRQDRDRKDKMEAVELRGGEVMVEVK